MNPLSIPYAFNILVLLPVGLLTLFGGERSGCSRPAYEDGERPVAVSAAVPKLPITAMNG